jgi:4-hydroxy-L-threonine phosphate dehydrogenase PdxA
MINKPIILVLGQKESVIYEILSKSLKSNKYKSPLLIITCKKEFQKQMKKYKFKKKFKTCDFKNLSKKTVFKNKINLIDVPYTNKIKFNLNKRYKQNYIAKTFDIAIDLINRGVSNKFLNGPINKTYFLDKKFLGITEYLAQKFKKNKFGMLIYNKELSVSPLTTHLPIKLVAKNVTKEKIIQHIKIINDFYLKNFKYKPKIAVTGLNPHCESILVDNEDKHIVSKAVNLAIKKNYLVKGPYSADTIFLRKNRSKFDVILGMYHDQILSPMKALFEYDAINITMGLPFIRVSPDHGPNEKMINKNLSSPQSLIKALKFLDKI